MGSVQYSGIQIITIDGFLKVAFLGEHPIEAVLVKANIFYKHKNILNDLDAYRTY